MRKYIIVFIILLVNIQAFEIRSWNIPNLNSNKDIEFIKDYASEEFDVMCVQNLNNLNGLKLINDDKDKDIYYSEKKLDENSSFGWIVNKNYPNSKIIEYKSNNIKFRTKPSMLILRDINIGIVNFYSDGDEKESLKEVGNIANLYQYFSKETKLESSRIFICGTFNLSNGKILKEIGDMYLVGNNEGSIISPKYGYTNEDYDHIISLYNGNIFVDYDILLKDWEKTPKEFNDRVSNHLPIKGIF